MPHPLLIFILIGLTLYSPIFFAGFAGDDFMQLVGQPLFHSPNGAIEIFENVIASPSGQTSLTGFFYRPLPFALQTIIYSTFPANPFPQHLIQIIFYITASYLVFLLFKTFFGHNLALLLAIIFLIHPANNDLGAYISAFPDTICLFFGILALLGIAKGKGLQTNVFFVSGALLCSLFSKETGAIFVVLATVLSLYKHSLHRYILPIAAALVTYLSARAAVSSNTLFTHLPTPAADYSLQEHFFLATQIAFTFLKEIVMPTRTGIKTGAFDPTFESTIFPGLVLGIFSLGCTFLWFALQKQDTSRANLFRLFLCWTILGMVLYLQFVPLEVIFADRWLYITEMGILGMFGVGTSLVTLKGRWITLCKILFIVLICFYAIETFVLNIMWLNWEKYFI